MTPATPTLSGARPRAPLGRIVRCLLLAMLLSAALAPATLPTPAAYAEGSRDLISRGGFRPFLEFRNDSAGGVLRRTTIKVYAKPGETLNLGSSANGVGGADGGRISYRDPQGATNNCPTSVGVISTIAQEVAGPLPNPGGYTPCTITVGAAQEGVWEVDFVSPDPSSRADPPTTPVAAQWVQPDDVGYVAAWDVLVRDAQGQPILGRTFANYLALNMGGNNVALNSEVFIQTRDGYRYRINLNGIDPFGFIFFANNKGFKDAESGAGLYRSVQFFGGNPGQLPGSVTIQNPLAVDSETDVTHKIFFEPPAPDLPTDAASPSGMTWLLRPPTLPPAPENFVFVGKEGTPGQAGYLLGGRFSFDAAAAGTYQITIDLNDNGQFGDANDVVLIGDAVIGTNSVEWDGRDASGGPVPASDTNYQAQVTLNAGEVHFPFVDPENNPRGLIIERQLPAGGNPERFTIHYDDSYRYTGANRYEFSLCSAGQTPPPPENAAIQGASCYGVPPTPPNARAGVNSNPGFNPATGEDGLQGGRAFSSNGGDRRGMDTWVYVPSPSVELGTLLAVKEADLAIFKTHAEPVAAGGPVRYTITVRNNGPSAVAGATVSDAMPPQVTDLSWSCQADPGAACGQASGSGPISTTVDLPVGAQAIFTLDGTVAPGTVGDLINTATVERPPDVTDPNPSNNSTSDRIVIGPRLEQTKQAALAIDADANGRPSAGDTIAYTILITNSGTSAATDVLLRDALPANTSYVVGSSRLNGVPLADGVGGALPFAAGQLASSPGAAAGRIEPGATATASFQVQINTPIPAGVSQIANVAVVDAPNAPPTTPATTTTTVAPTPALAASKNAGLALDADGDGVPSPGDTIAYTITIVNSGGGAATGVTYSDAPDPNGTLVPGSVTASQGTVTGGNAGTPPVTAALGSIAPGASATLSYRVTVNDPLAPGVSELVNQGIASSGNTPPVKTDDPRTPEPNDPTRVPLTAQPRLQQIKRDTLLFDADANGRPSPGDRLLYTIEIANNGNTAAENLVLDDTPDANTTLVAGSVQTTQGTIERGNSPGDTAVRVSLGALPARGGQATVSFEVTINNPLPAGVSEVANQALISGDNVPPGKSDDPKTPTPDDPTRTPVFVSPAIDSTKSATLIGDVNGNGLVEPGDTLLYLVEIANIGNGAATGVIYRDTPDPNTTIVAGSVQPSQGSVALGNAGGRTILVNLGTIAPGAKARIGYRVTVNSPLPAGVSRVSNQGTTSGNFPPDRTDDPRTPTPDDPTVVPVTNLPLLDLTKRDTLLLDADGNGAASAGDTLRYTIDIINIGSVSATGTSYDDTPDPNTTLVPGSVTTSQGTVTSGNAGAPPVTVDIGAIPPGAQVTISYDVRVNSPLPAGVSEVVNQGTLTGENVPGIRSDDPDTPASDDPTRTPLIATPLLDATKADALVGDVNGNGLAEAGDTVEYRILIDNRGGAAATNVTFSDTPDANTTLVPGSVTTTQGTITGGNAGTPPVTVDIGTIPAGGRATVSFRVTINPLPPGVREIANQGTISTPDQPAIPTDDPDTPASDDPTRTPVGATPLLESPKRDALLTDANGDGAASPGDTLLYTIDIVNRGSAAATGVVFRDTPDTNTRLIAGSVQASRGTVVNGNAAGENQVIVELGTLPPGERVQISFRVRVIDPTSLDVTRLFNQGIVTGGNIPPTPTDDPDTPEPNDPTATPLILQPQLSATKGATLVGDADGDGAASPGDTLLYTIEIVNQGGAAAAGVVFSDTIDPNTTLIPGTALASQGTITAGGAGGSLLSVAVGTIAPAQRVTISYRTQINSPLPPSVTQVSNRGLAQPSNSPETPTDNPRTGPDDPTVVPIGLRPLLSTTKRDLLFDDLDGDGAASPGEIVLYLITIQNSGGAAATGVTFSDTPDPNTTIVAGSITASQGSVTGGNAGTPPVAVNLGTIQPGQSATIAFQVRVNDPLAETVTQVANQGRFSSGNGGNPPTDDPDTPDPDDPTRTDISRSSGLRIGKTDGGAEIRPGEVVRYTLSYTNTGVTPLFDVLVRETVPEHTTFDAANSSLGWSCPNGAPAGTACTISVGTLPGSDGTGAGGSGSVVFALRLNSDVPESVERIENIATIGTSARPASGNDPRASDDTPIVGPTLVVLTSFDAIRDGGGALVRWETALELDSGGFHLYRSANGQRAGATRVTGALIPARGSATSGARYEFFDSTASPYQSYSYWLEEIEIDGGRNDYGPAQLAPSQERPGEWQPED
jgi:uncharacterized repeat protein (TIGR01451 family)